VNPWADNLVGYATNDPSVANTVYAVAGLNVGTDYIIGTYVSDAFASMSAIYFNIDSFIEGKTVQSAVLKLNIWLLPTDMNTTYAVNPIADTWNTNTLTWNNCPYYYNSPTVIIDPPYTWAIPWEIDITPIVQSWANGTITNFGIYIRDNTFVWPWPSYTCFRTTWCDSNESAQLPEYKPTLHLDIQ